MCKIVTYTASPTSFYYPRLAHPNDITATDLILDERWLTSLRLRRPRVVGSDSYPEFEARLNAMVL